MDFNDLAKRADGNSGAPTIGTSLAVLSLAVALHEHAKVAALNTIVTNPQSFRADLAAARTELSRIALS